MPREIKLPDLDGSTVKAVVFGSSALFVCGLDSKTRKSTFRRYNLASKSPAVPLKPPPEKNCGVRGFTMAMSGTSIYLVGGNTEKIRFASPNLVNSCFRYSIEENKWKRLADMPEALIEPNVCCLDEKVFVSGGHDASVFKNKMYEYNSTTGTWSTLAPVQWNSSYRSPSAANVVPRNGQLYTFGKDTIRRYDADRNQWMEVPRSECLGRKKCHYGRTDEVYFSFDLDGKVHICTRNGTCYYFPMLDSTNLLDWSAFSVLEMEDAILLAVVQT